MRVAVCYTKTNSNGISTSDAFYEGVLSSGDYAEKIYEDTQDKIIKNKYDVIMQVCDISPIDNHDCFRGLLRKSNIPRIVVDTGCLNNKREYPADLDRYVSVGFNGVKGDALYFNTNEDSIRYKKLQWNPKDWKYDGEYVLILGQKRFGLSVYEFDINLMLSGIVYYFNSIGVPILFRKHPLEKELPSGKFRVSQGSLSDDLSNARCAYGLSTNALVEAIYMGVPGITGSNKSLAYSVSSHSLDLDKLIRPDRTQWLYNLSYTQWHLNEMRSGECWQRYRGYIKCV